MTIHTLKKLMLLSVIALATAHSKTITVDSVSDVQETGKCTLREAIALSNDNTLENTGANNCSIDMSNGLTSTLINFDATVVNPDNPIILTSNTQLPNLSASVTIDGGSSNGVIIDGNIDPDDENSGTAILEINIPTDPDNSLKSRNVVFKNLTFRNAKGAIIATSFSNFLVDSCNFSNNKEASRGAGIWAKSLAGKIIVKNSIFSDNDTIDEYQSGGGAIKYENKVGDLLIENSLFKNNSAPTGGAISAGGSVTIFDSVFIENRANELLGDDMNIYRGNGGAIYHAENTLTINDSLFSNNTAYEAGAIYNKKPKNQVIASLIISNSQFIQNSAAATTSESDYTYDPKYGTIFVWSHPDVSSVDIADSYFLDNAGAEATVLYSSPDASDNTQTPVPITFNNSVLSNDAAGGTPNCVVALKGTSSNNTADDTSCFDSAGDQTISNEPLVRYFKIDTDGKPLLNTEAPCVLAGMPSAKSCLPRLIEVVPVPGVFFSDSFEAAPVAATSVD